MKTARKSPVLISALCTCLATAGCASIFHGTAQTIDIVTDPPGASASSGDQRVTTPGALRLPRKAKISEIRIEKEGFAAKAVILHRLDSGLVWLNMIGIPVGIVGGFAVGCGSSSILSCSDRTGAMAIAGGAGLPALGFLTDYTSGGAYRLDPDKVVVRLEPVINSAPTEKQ